jgi:hypothetical protein
VNDTRDTFGGMVRRSFLPAVRPGRPRAVAMLAALLVLGLPVGVADAAPTPGAPSITSVTPGDGTLTVAFTPPAGGCAGCTYIVEASVSADFATFAARSTSQTSPVPLLGLTNGTEYHVRAHVRVLGFGLDEISEFVGDGTIGGAGIRYRVHTFAPAGSFVLQVDRDVDVEALVVAGGGSGGSGRGGGGGGAGGMIQEAPTLSAGTHTITVGAGGESRTNARGQSGSDSVLPTSGGSLTAVGGGGGGSGAGSSTTDPVRAGLPGGSGGGSRTNTNLTGGTGVNDQGEDGGRGLTGGLIGGGGGGAGGPGADGGGGGSPPAAPFGDGGPGSLSSITGVSLFYAAGGGGGGTSGVFPSLSNGGTGGGGDGAKGTGGDQVGSPGTTPGSGGGGGGDTTNDASGAGADGIVILRHVMNVAVHPVTVAPGVPVPVTASDSASGAAPLTLTCDPSTPVAGGSLVCRMSGGDPDVDILWRAAVGSGVIEGVVRTAGDGSGEFRVDLPRGSVGQAVSVELVAWLAPLELGVATGPVPSAVPAGATSTPMAAYALFAALAVAGGLMLGRRTLGSGR